ncbi:proline-rich protein 36-like isoform X2 [Sinocyclocheilus anshuiensis]|uniref:proline-rich protein 36-like isoform X2 n=1 Tax=Sinocyclocheilus anshuiensis TaxID=1608454 RepID=UPI0007B7F225|nr:PREDICTED: proline-rich protein 36-like isoform X2 [Sinocyclocheilus anshuiensis]
MPWAKGILLFTMAVVILSSSLRADPEAFSEAGAAYGAVSENTVGFGKLLNGGQGTVSIKNVKTSALRSEESDGHRSNEEAWFHPASTKLHRLGSFVRCSNDSMILCIPGQRMPHFLVDRGEESPVPLSEMPASCGFSLKRARRDVSLVAPYRGCHVRKLGGSYILPLIIMGAPVQMSCPASPLLPTVSCFSSSMTVKFGVRADDVKVKVAGSWQPLLQKYTECSFTLETTAGSLVVTAPFTGSCWEVMDTERRLPLMYGDQEVTLSCPLTQPTIAPTTPVHDPSDMQQMFDPFPFGRPWWYPPYPGVPATMPPTVPPTTPPPPFQYPFQQPMFPHMYPMPIFDPFYSKGYPFAPPAPQQSQHPWYPKFPPYMNGFQSPVEGTTPAMTTTAPYQPEQYPGYPMYPPFYGHQPMKSFVSPTVKYPFMPQYPKYPIFGPRSPKSPSSPARLSSVYRSRR